MLDEYYFPYLKRDYLVLCVRWSRGLFSSLVDLDGDSYNESDDIYCTVMIVTVM